ncbi:hypothetical protein WJX72_008884 [[Myrmecia] bisecta]|uniref:ABC transporter domain-containing protein n=1 Tax=[Myrmecia] bisecta TaxID=41462 RepID=A0AAW1P4C8_9CHLO
MPVAFQNLTYVVRSHADRNAKVTLISAATGYFRPGQMTALMGASGSGKTTLLDVLAGRKTVGETSGSIRFGGEAPSPMFLRRYTGYVEQFDTLIEMLTPAEMLLYTAELKCPVSEPLEGKRARVDTLIEALGLNGCRNTRIGSPLVKGISGGQAKRTNVGLALITSPRVLFLDEPTTGLDSTTANEVMATVRSLTKTGITICSTIHSPTQKCLNMFGMVLLLLGGRIVYFGEQGGAMVEYFAPKAHLLTEPVDDMLGNQAEWIVDLTTQANKEGRAEEFAGLYQASSLCQQAASSTQALASKGSNISPHTLAALSTQRGTVTSVWHAVAVMLKYRTKGNLLSPAWVGARIAGQIVMAALAMLLFHGIGQNFAQTNLINISAILFIWGAIPLFNASSYIPSLYLERPLYYRERSDGLYRPITYICSRLFDEVVLTVVVTAVFSVSVWFVLKLQGQFTVFWLSNLATNILGVEFAYLSAGLGSTLDVANAMLPAYGASLMFTAGFFLRKPAIPVYLRWYTYINPVRYAWGASMINQFAGTNTELFPDQEILHYFELSGSCWAYIGYQMCFVVVLFLATWVVTAYVKHAKR